MKVETALYYVKADILQPRIEVETAFIILQGLYLHRNCAIYFLYIATDHRKRRRFRFGRRHRDERRVSAPEVLLLGMWHGFF